MKYYSAVKKKKENLTFCDSMDGLGDYYAKEISQSEKDNYHMISLLWDLMSKIN